jgi:hypothetical protein
MANASIFSQFVKPVRSMQEYSNDMDAAEQNKLALAAKRMQMQQAEAGVQDQTRIRGLASQYGDNPNKLVEVLRGGGYLDQAGALEKQIGERAKSQADTAKSAQDVQSKKLADAEKRLQIAGQAFGYVKDNPSAESAASVVQHLQQNGIWDDKQVAAAMAEIQANPTPEGVLKLATRAFQGVLDAKEQLPKYFQQGRGSTAAIVGVSPVSGASQDVQSAPILQSADSVARIAAAAEQGDKTRAQSERASLRVDSRARDAAARADGTAVAEAGGPAQAALVKQLGKPPKDYRWKADGSAEPIPGGPADLKSGEQGAKASAKRESQVAQAESVLSTIADAKKLVGYNTAGVGGLLAKVPMTDARNLQAKLETVKANLGFDRLQQMRDQSPTGGALGAVAVQELVALQSTVASLDQLQSPPEIGKALQKIEGHYRRWVDVMQQGQGGQAGASGDWGDKPAAKGGVVDFGSLK